MATLRCSPQAAVRNCYSRRSVVTSQKLTFLAKVLGNRRHLNWWRICRQHTKQRVKVSSPTKITRSLCEWCWVGVMHSYCTFQPGVWIWAVNTSYPVLVMLCRLHSAVSDGCVSTSSLVFLSILHFASSVLLDERHSQWPIHAKSVAYRTNNKSSRDHVDPMMVTSTLTLVKSRSTRFRIHHRRCRFLFSLGF